MIKNSKAFLIVFILLFFFSVPWNAYSFLQTYSDDCDCGLGTGGIRTGIIVGPPGEYHAYLKELTIDNSGYFGSYTQSTVWTRTPPQGDVLFTGNYDLGIISTIPWSATESKPAASGNLTGIFHAVVDWTPTHSPDDSNNGPPKDGCTGLPIVVGQPINVATGNMYHKELDFEYSGLLKMERWYNSYPNYSGKFGWNWTNTYETNLVSEAYRIKIVTPTGGIRYYAGTGSSYTPYPGTEGSLAYGGGTYTETLYDGSKNYFDSTGRLIKYTTPTGNVLNLDYSQPSQLKVNDEYGKNITIQYRADGKIDWVDDPAGNRYNYVYDDSVNPTNGNLSSATYADGTTKHYLYDQASSFPHHLTEITVTKDNQSRTVASWRYGTGTPSSEPNGYAVESSTDGTNDKVTLSYNTSTNTTTVSNSLGHASTYNYDDIGGIKKTRDVTGNCGCTAGSASYDSSGNINSSTDKNNNITAYSNYDGKGNPGKIVEASGTANQRTTTYSYNSATGEPTVIKRKSAIPFGNNSTFTIINQYENNRLTNTNRQGNTKDINGDVHSFNYSSSFLYNAKGGIRQSTDALNRVTTFDYYSTTWGHPNHGQLKSVTRTVSGQQVVTSFGNYSSGKAGWKVDPKGAKYVYTYDSRGRLLGVSAHSRVTRMGYDAFGNMTSMTSPKGNRTGFTYDAANRLEKITDGEGNYLSFTYDTEGNREIASAYDSGNTLLYTTRNIYDVNNKLQKITNPAQSITYSQYGYDGKGNLSSLKDNNARETVYGYDNLDRLNNITLPEPDTGAGTIISSFLSDINDQRTSATDGKNNTVLYTYDDLGQLCDETQDGKTTRYEYDAVGNRTKIKDPKGNVTTFEYNELDLPKKKIYQDTKYETYTYTETGKIKTKTNARNIVTTYNYDPDTDDLTSITYSDSTPSVVYANNDTYERVDSITVGGLTWAYTYDGNARVETVDGPWDNDTVTYTYDPKGKVKTIQQNGGDTITYNYDTIERLHDVNAGGRVFNYTYGGTGSANPVPESLTRPNGNATSYTYDAIFRLKDIANKKSDGVTILTENAFTYDKAHMKTQETVTNGAAMSLAAATVTYQHNNVNQLESSTGPARSYVYDADGNMTTGYTPDNHQSTAEYDAENRMKNIWYTDSSGNVQRTEFSYNTDGFVAREIRKVNGAEVGRTCYVRDGYYCLQERNGANAVTRAYVWDHVSPGGIGGLLEMTKDGKRYNYYYDGKGNVSACINADLALANADGEFVYYAYDSFGSQVSQTGTLEQPFRFSTKYYYAGYGLYDYGYRFYNPMVGKWMTRDPLGEEGGGNLYEGIGNNAVNKIDPLGLKPPDFPFPVAGPNEFYYVTQQNVNYARSINNPYTFYNLVRNHGQWDYKQQQREYADFGNYNFGATGAATGLFTLETLLREAGRAQCKAGTSQSGWGNPSSGPPYGDAPNDQYWIIQGWNDYMNGMYGKQYDSRWVIPDINNWISKHR